jgi:hypothetical protein
MSALTLLVGMALAGQIAAEGDRYPFNAAAAADGNLFDGLDEPAGDGPAAGTPAQGSDVPPTCMGPGSTSNQRFSECAIRSIRSRQLRPTSRCRLVRTRCAASVGSLAVARDATTVGVPRFRTSEAARSNADDFPSLRSP